MKKKSVKMGIAFHCHHHRLFELCHGFTERERFIRGHKPRQEKKLRLRLFKLIPRTKLSDELRKALEAWIRASDVTKRFKWSL